MKTLLASFFTVIFLAESAEAYGNASIEDVSRLKNEFMHDTWAVNRDAAIVPLVKYFSELHFSDRIKLAVHILDNELSRSGHSDFYDLVTRISFIDSYYGNCADQLLNVDESYNNLRFNIGFKLKDSSIEHLPFWPLVYMEFMKQCAAHKYRSTRAD